MASSATKPVMIVGVDESNHSFHALEWTLDHFVVPFANNQPYRLVIVHARPTATSVLGLAGAAVADVIPIVEVDLKRIAGRVVEKIKSICSSKSVEDANVEVMEGDARTIMCEAVDKHQATILVLGSHGYNAMKRVVLGSVSDYCAHHANCSVMIVKQPKAKN